MDTLITLIIVAGCFIFLGLKALRSFQGKGNGCGCGCAGGCSSDDTMSGNTQSDLQTHIQHIPQQAKQQEGKK